MLGCMTTPRCVRTAVSQGLGWEDGFRFEARVPSSRWSTEWDGASWLHAAVGACPRCIALVSETATVAWARPPPANPNAVVCHHVCQVYVEARQAATLARDGPVNATLAVDPSLLETEAVRRAGRVQVDILVEGMGRQNFGCTQHQYDTKGLQSTHVTLNGTAGVGGSGWQRGGLRGEEASRVRRVVWAAVHCWLGSADLHPRRRHVR